jgi:hypothetical protein
LERELLVPELPVQVKLAQAPPEQLEQRPQQLLVPVQFLDD